MTDETKDPALMAYPDDCWAHSLPGMPEESWEPLRRHLVNVAKTASSFANAIGGSELGHVAGLLHDLGKAKPEFQEYLRGIRASEPHSAEGAHAAATLLPKGLGRLVAFTIAGHHSGLANGVTAGSGLSTLDDRILAARDLTPIAEALPLQPITSTPGPIDAASPDPAFTASFFIRMLFSCLVDADFLETERFYADSRRAEVDRKWVGSLTALRSRLDARLAAFDPSATPVAQVRAEVLASCRDRASDAIGLFSLTVPTGGGKTLSSLAFALNHAIAHGLERIVYVIPFTSVIEQTAKVFREALEDPDAVLEHHSAFEFDQISDDHEAKDGVEKLRRASENWDRPIVVTTAVQFFESLFSNRPSRCRKLHNLARAVIILDEAQTLPLRLLRPCLAAVRELAQGYGSTIVLCTATQPAVRVEDGFMVPEALSGVRELAPRPPELYNRLRRVEIRMAGRVSIAELAARLTCDDQVLCIVNNRAHARALLQALRDSGQMAARLLTTAITAADRAGKLDSIKLDLLNRRPVHVVATSLIEAGVDVDFPVVWRAMAGIDSIAQAAGRCNREGLLGSNGRVFVFEPDEDSGRPPPELRQFAEAARVVLSKHDDALSLEAVRDYFAEIYWRRGEEALDAAKVGRTKGILKAIQNTGARLDFPFADISEAFRMIETAMLPVVIPATAGGRNAPRDLLARLAHADTVGGLARRLQPYVVQVPARARHALIEQGAARAIRDDVFGLQFVVLENLDLYDPEIGLDWSDPSYRDVESNIL